MLKWVKKYYLLLPVVLAALAALLSFKPGTMIAGGDIPFFEYFPFHHLQLSSFIWNPLDGVGRFVSSQPSALVVASIDSLLLKLFNPIFVQKFTFTVLTIAPIFSIDYLVKKIFKDDDRVYLISLVATLFYVFNLYELQQWAFGTIMYQVVYFTTPLLFAFLIRGYKEKHNLLYFTLVCVINTIVGANVAIFVGQVIALMILAIFLTIFSKERGKTSCYLFSYALIYLAINSIWLTGFLLSFIGSLSLATSNDWNQIITQGSVKSVIENNHLLNTFRLISATFYGFWDGKFDFPSSRAYNQPFLVYLNFSFLSFVISGFIVGFRKSKAKKYLIIFLVMLLIGFFAAKGAANPFSSIVIRLMDKFSWFAMFRTPQNKFGPMLMIPFAILFSWGFKETILFLFKNKILRLVSFCAIIALIVINVFPYWQGRMFFSRYQVSMPQSYTDTADFLNKDQGFSRILTLPFFESTWISTKWGYEGYDPLYFMLKKPVFSRGAEYMSQFNQVADAKIMSAIGDESLSDFLSACRTYNIDTIIVHKDYNFDTFKIPNVIKRFDAIRSKTDKIILVKESGELLTYNISTKDNNQEIRTLDNPALYFGDTSRVAATKQYDTLFDGYIFAEQNESALAKMKKNIKNQIFSISDKRTQMNDGRITFAKGFSGLAEVTVEAKSSGRFDLNINGKEYEINADPANNNLCTIGELNLADGVDVLAKLIDVVTPEQYGDISKLEMVDVSPDAEGSSQFSLYKSPQTVNGQPVISLRSNNHKVGIRLNVPSIDKNANYSLSFDYKNVSGKPGMYVIEGINHKEGGQALNEVLKTANLPATNSWTHYSMIFQPQPYPEMYIYFYSDSNGLENTENLYGNVNLKKIDLPINSILIADQSIKDLGSSALDFNKISPVQYNVSTSKSLIGKVILFNQGFNKQWVMNGENSNLTHLTANGFANAWIVEGSSDKLRITFADQKKFVFSYYFASGALIIVILGAILGWVKRKWM